MNKMVKEVIVEGVKYLLMTLTYVGFFGLLLYKLWEKIR